MLSVRGREQFFQCGSFEGDGATLRTRRGMDPHWKQSTSSQYSVPQCESRTRRGDVLIRFGRFPPFVGVVELVVS